MAESKPKTYLLSGCPFCMTFVLFMAESSHLDELDLVILDPKAPDYEPVKQRLTEASGDKVTFPMVEVEPGVYRKDSDKLIEYFAKRFDVDASKLPALSYYGNGLLPNYIAMYKENMGLKQLLESRDAAKT